jgi:hypothetical protein
MPSSRTALVAVSWTARRLPNGGLRRRWLQGGMDIPIEKDIFRVEISIVSISESGDRNERTR